MSSFQVVVVGGGAAGMMAAGRSAELGAETCLLEKNSYLGKKIGITGKGRCNLTTSTPTVHEIVDEFSETGRFLYSALGGFSNLDTIEFFNSMGLDVVFERGNRVFPASERARDVARALERYMVRGAVHVFLGCPVQDVRRDNKGWFNVKTPSKDIITPCLVLATGGLSYPGTGSTGDGYQWARKLGHTITPLLPALVPLETEETWPARVQGLALKNVSAALLADGEVLLDLFGEMLFTHFGVSGPMVLTLSGKAAEALSSQKKVRLSIDLKPGLTAEKLDRRLQRDLEKYSRKQLRTALGDVLPKALIPIVLDLAGLDAGKEANQVARVERNRLTECLKSIDLSITGTRPFEEAIVTAGGVSVGEIDPRTMQSKIVPNLFFAGEIIDVDGNTGGYNLQAAFSTGYAAGSAAAAATMKKG